MSHLLPPSDDALEALEPIFAAAAASMGFVPNSMRTMAHMPQLPVALLLLASTSYGGDLKGLIQGLGERIPAGEPSPDNLPASTVQLIAYASSVRAGCRYCQAHTSHTGHKAGAEAAQFADILRYESSPLFSAAERALVDMAFAAAATPNEVTASHFEALRGHFSERQIVQIVAVISTFGFLNRWNDTMATQLEDVPRQFANDHLGPLDWQSGKHG